MCRVLRRLCGAGLVAWFCVQGVGDGWVGGWVGLGGVEGGEDIGVEGGGGWRRWFCADFCGFLVVEVLMQGRIRRGGHGGRGRRIG